MAFCLIKINVKFLDDFQHIMAESLYKQILRILKFKTFVKTHKTLQSTYLQLAFTAHFDFRRQKPCQHSL